MSLCPRFFFLEEREEDINENFSTGRARRVQTQPNSVDWVGNFGGNFKVRRASSDDRFPSLVGAIRLLLLCMKKGEGVTERMTGGVR